jgi:hypothetical protein
MKILFSCLLFLASAWAQNADCILKGGSDLPAGKQKRLDALLHVTAGSGRRSIRDGIGLCAGW